MAIGQDWVEAHALNASEESRCLNRQFINQAHQKKNERKNYETLSQKIASWMLQQFTLKNCWKISK